MKYFFFLFFSSLLAFVANAQKTINDPNAEVRVVQGSFRAIQVDGGIDLYLSQGDEAVAVSARDAETRGRIRRKSPTGS